MILNLWRFDKSEFTYDNSFYATTYVLIFKVIVLLLLLKMLIAIIFGSYRKIQQAGSITTAKELSGQAMPKTSVAEDIALLLRHQHDWMWNILMPQGNWYVPPSVLMQFTTHPKLQDECDIVDNATHLHKLFKKTFHPDGVCGGMRLGHSHAEWLMTRYGKQRSRPKDDRETFMTREQVASVYDTFQKFDRDGSGTIDYKEFQRALGLMKHPHAYDHKYVTSAMRKINTHHTGVIDFQEFLKFVADDIGMKVSEEEDYNDATYLENTLLLRTNSSLEDGLNALDEEGLRRTKTIRALDEEAAKTGKTTGPRSEAKKETAEGPQKLKRSS